MVKEFVKAWEKNKGALEEYFRTHKQGEYDEYVTLVKLLFDIVINPVITDPAMWSQFNFHNTSKFDTENIVVLDDGDYQGTRVFILHRDCYQPSVENYIYTNTYYGSCSGCDTLQGIHCYDYDDLPSDEQVEDYMTLCLHLLQRCSFMVDGEEE